MLSGTRRSGNLGLVARAMKNTGLLHLLLVQCVDHRSKTAATFGAPAKEILEGARVGRSLAAVLQSSCYVVGFTRREGKMRLPLDLYLDLVPKILARARQGKVHLVFGNERTGLTTDELSRCDAAAYLPSNPRFPSMNLSHAVMLVGYELLKACSEKQSLGGVAPAKPLGYPTKQQMGELMVEMKDTLRRLDYRDMPRLKLLSSIMNNLERMLKRCAPTSSEANMMRGILSRLDQRLPK